MCFNEAIVPSMFKHVASKNGPLVLILQLFSKFHCKAHYPKFSRTDLDYQKL